MSSSAAENQSQLWSFSYIVTLIINLSSNTITSMLVSTLPLFIQARGGTTTEASLMVTLFTFAVLLVRPLAGFLIDHVGRKPVLLTGFFLVLVSCVVYSFEPAVALVLALRVLQGMGFGLQTTAIATIFSDIVPPSRRVEGLGYSGVIGSLTSAIGPAIGLWILADANFSVLSLVSIVLCASGMVLAWIIKPVKSPQERKVEVRRGEPLDAAGAAHQGTRPGLGRFIEKSALPASCVLFFIAFDYAAVLTFLSPYAASRNIPNISIFFWVYAACMLITRPAVNWITRRIGIRRVILPGNLLLLVSFILLVLAMDVWYFILAAVAFGIGFGIVQPALATVVTELAPVHRRGVANSTLFIAMDLGIGLGAVVWGAVSQAVDHRAVFVGAALGVILSSLCFFLLLRGQLLRQQDPRP